MATLSQLQVLVQDIIQDSSFSLVDIRNYLNQGVQEIAGGMQSSVSDCITPPLPELFTIGSVTTDTDDAAYSTYAAIKTLISAGDTLVFTYNGTTFTVTATDIYTNLQADIDTTLIAGAADAGSIVVSWAANDLILTCAGDVKEDTIIGGVYTDIDTGNTVEPTDTSFVAAAANVPMPANFQRNLQYAVNSDGVEIDIYNSMSSQGLVQAVMEAGNILYYQGIPTTGSTITLHFYRFPVDMSESTDTPDGIPLHLQVPLLVNYAAKEVFKLIEDGVEGDGVNTARYQGLFLQAMRTLELSVPFDTNPLSLSV